MVYSEVTANVAACQGNSRLYSILKKISSLKSNSVAH